MPGFNGYVTLLTRIWIADDGALIRATIQDVRTGAQFPVDLSGVTAFLRASIEDAVDSGVRESHEDTATE